MTEETSAKPKRGRPKKAETATAETTDTATNTATLSERSPDLGIINREQTHENELRRQWREDRQMVKGVFRMHEPPGGHCRMSFRKYKWDPIETYDFHDGQEYEIPLGVARHLNTRTSYAVHQHVLGPDGNPTVDRQGKKMKRMSFESLEFM